MVLKEPGKYLHILPLALVLFFTAPLALLADGIDDQQVTQPGMGVVQTARFERLLVKGIEAINRGDLEAAGEFIERLVEQKPNFHLAQLILGDIYMARAGLLKKFGQATVDDDHPKRQDLLDEVRARITHLMDYPPSNAIPSPLLYLSDTQSHAIVVDLNKSRFYLFRNVNGVPVLQSDYYVSSGKKGADKYREGDKKTPIGVYFVTEQKAANTLPDFYGAGALPLNYPNEWDRLQRRTGYGIWLHGTPIGLYSRPPRASDGCVALTNPDYSAMEKLLGIGAPVVIATGIKWISYRKWLKKRKRVLLKVQQWYRDWLSRKPKRVLRHYAKDFQNLSSDYDDWAREIREELADREGAYFKLSDLSIFGYPHAGKQAMMVVTFQQDYFLRRQYWRQEKNRTWKIVYEDTG